MTTAMRIRLEAVSRRVGITKALLVASVVLLVLIVTEFVALLEGNTAIGLAAVMVTGVLLASYTAFAVFFVVAPIRRLVGKTAQLAAGDLTARADDERATEIDELASGFNEMAETLELRRAELGAVLDSTTDGLLMADMDGRIVFSNAAMNGFAESIGVVGENVYERILSVARRTAHAEEFAEAYARIAENPEEEYESEFVLLDVGRTFVGHTAPVRDVGGELLGRIFTLREITREREAEQVKDEFVATVSHELRTPLTSIRGFLDLLLAGEGGELTADQRRFLTVVQRNSERLLRLVGDLLLVAQLDAGSLRLELSVVDLVDVAAEAVEAARPAAEAAELTLELGTHGVPIVAGDRERLAQLLDNLISNAIKFTPRGGRVDVAAATDGDDVSLVVSDTGTGMTEDELGRLYTRFYRTARAGRDQIPGTGLGLAISKAIAEAHGGSISVESVVGGGTTFRVELPRTPLGCATYR